MLKWIGELWAINDPLPEKVDAIALISYAATKNTLTMGSWHTIDMACKLGNRYPEAVIIGGTFSKNPSDMEQKLKVAILTTYRAASVGLVSNSIDECKAVLKAAGDVKSIIVVADGWHSRRDKIIWKNFFKGDLCFRSVPGCLCADRENPMWIQRYSPIWMLVNVILTPFYKWLPGVDWFAKKNFSQPVS